jgi:L-ascorbate metabolism protein UlaG (beta-lactamase superfamily)
MSLCPKNYNLNKHSVIELILDMSKLNSLGMKRPNHNPSLPFVKDQWNGNPLTEKGNYTNLDADDIKSFSDVFKWMTGPRPLTHLKKGQQSPLSFQIIDQLNKKDENALIPLGHAGFIVDMNQKRMVIDPLIVKNPFLKRHTDIPLDPHKLVNVDYILLSHNHRDHIDKSSIKLLCNKNPEAFILTGLGVEKILRQWGIKNQIQEAGWYQGFETSPDLEIHYLPTKHWTRRWLTDTNNSLWGSFMLTNPMSGKSVYYGSDSGYGDHFKEISKMYDIDIALIGIGAYEPRWFMNQIHMGPDEALMAIDDLNAKKWMPMHYGTLDLSDEPIYYPEHILKKELKYDKSRIEWMQIGKRSYF